MIQTIKISPVKKTFDKTFKTFESSLADQGYYRFPATHTFLTPKREADGRYRTGVDKKAVYLNKLSDEQRKIELDLIDELIQRLKDSFGDGVDFGPRSKIWNAYSEEIALGEVRASAIKVGNGTLIVNPDAHPQQLLDYCWLRIHPSIAKSAESYNRGECRTCTYYVENEEVENRVLYNKKKKVNDAIVSFSSLTPTKRKQIARLLLLPVTDSTTEEGTYNVVDSFLRDGDATRGSGRQDPIKEFDEIMQLDDDLIYIKDLVEQAFRHNIYRKGDGDTVMIGNKIAYESKEELVRHLFKTENQKEMLALSKMLEAKKVSDTV